MNRPDGSLTTPEGEIRFQSSSRILVTGGATGAGLELSSHLATLGSDVVIGTRYISHYDGASQTVDQKSSGGVEVSPFIADLTSNAEIDIALNGLKEFGRMPTDVVLSAAGGMEPFMKDFIRDLAAIRRASSSEEKMGKVEFLKLQVERWAEESMQFAQSINFQGNVDLLETLKKIRGESSRPMRVIFYSSLPSTFVNQEEPPSFYRVVAITKGRFEKWMDEHWEEYADAGIYFGVQTMHGIEDTNVVTIGRRYIMPLMKDEDQLRLNAAFIKKERIPLVTTRMLNEDISKWQNGVRKIFMIGQNDYENLTVDDPRYVSLRFRLKGSGNF